MAHYVTSVRTGWPAQTAFEFMADLRNFASWDPGVRSARLVVGAAPGPDAAFDVDVAVWFGTMRLRYVVTEWTPPTRLVACAETSTLRSLDEIRVESRDDGTTIVTYDADLQFTGLSRIANPVLNLAFRRIGDRAAAGLRRVLTQETPPR
jgi:hypothetical protein